MLIIKMGCYVHITLSNGELQKGSKNTISETVYDNNHPRKGNITQTSKGAKEGFKA